MKITKKIISNLEKCYSIASLEYNGAKHTLVAAEKVDRCLLFNSDGQLEDTVWTEPGGVMSMVQIPGTNGEFLATHKFYSPNDSKEAKIVIVTPQGKNDWEVRTLVNLPHVHRFDIISANGVNYVLACTLKSGHEYKDDWSNPGKVYACELPSDLSIYDDNNQLELHVIKDNMLKNHGYYKVTDHGITCSIISAEQGVFQFIPPQTREAEWTINQLLSTPSSDACLIDLDGDGEAELVTLAPFHGTDISIYKKQMDTYEKVYTYPKSADFVHALWCGNLCKIPTVVVGHRQGSRDLLAFTYNATNASYTVEIIDTNCGPANVAHYLHDNKDILISANRETDEVAMYIIEK